jgi:ABC-2 type transport system permease protein
LIAKVLTGMVLILVAILFLHLLGGFGVVNFFDYLAFIVVGGFSFSAYGIFLGFLCRNQASARTLGVAFYLPHLLPSALSDFSSQLATVAPLLPSCQFYEPIKSILLEDGKMVNMSIEWVYLLTVGLFAFYLSYVLIKRRWLM